MEPDSHFLVNTGFKEQYEELNVKYEELTKSLADTIASHGNDLEQAKQAHAAVVVALDNKENAHAKTLEELKATHAKNLDEAHDRAMSAGHTAQAIELEQIKSDHAEVLASLKQEYSATQAGAAADAEKLKVMISSLPSKIETADNL